MLINKDMLELKKRFTKEKCTITRLAGCYVDADSNKLLSFNNTFLNLEDDELYKYLDIAKKSLSGTIGNNLLPLEFIKNEDGEKMQQLLLSVRESGLKNDDLLDCLYDIIIENFHYVGNYLILVFKDSYDVMTKTTDELKLDESEEVFDYFIVSICPVKLSKPGLGYLEGENRIGSRIQDWVVDMPDTAFTFPSFVERSTDIHTISYYIKDAKDSHHDFIEKGLKCCDINTATEERNTFSSVVKSVVSSVMEKSDEVLCKVQESLQDIVITHEAETEGLALPEDPDLILTTDIIDEVLKENDIPFDTAETIKAKLSEEFGEMTPTIKNLVDEKAIEKNQKKQEAANLRKEISELRKENDEKSKAIDTLVSMEGPIEDTEEAKARWAEVFLRMKPDKAENVRCDIIDGKKYLMIPIEDEEHINLNGVDTTI